MGVPVTLAVLGDAHGPSEGLERALQRLRQERLDGVLLVGDLSAGLHLRSGFTPAIEAEMRATAAAVVERVEALGVPVLWVPGNHDLPDLAGPGNVDHTVATVAGVRVAGVGGGGPMQFGFAYEWSDEELSDRAVPPCDVLLCHAPPVDTALDLTFHGIHAGSRTIRAWAEAHDGVLVCGHIHEAAGVVRLGRCRCLNAGALGGMLSHPYVGFVRQRPGGGWSVVLEDLESGQRRSL